jgi:4-methyl-5(b-hydroxyethyl)-thiazole monophosphate biosynthesis
VKDKNVITSKGLGTALEFAAAIIEHYEGIEKADQIKSSVQY